MARSDWTQLWKRDGLAVVKNRHTGRVILFRDGDFVESFDTPEAAMDYADTHYPMEREG